MGMTAGSGRGGMKSDINITPLVDVVLVLLIIFMVVTPMMKRGKAVQLPKAANSGEGAEKSDPLVLSMTADQKIYVESDLYADEERFKVRLKQELRAQPARRLLLKADNGLACGDVQKVLRWLHDSGARNVGLGVAAQESP